MKFLYYSVCLFLLSFCLSGCATIVTGTDQNVTFNSTPDGATVTVDGKVVGKTPFSMKIKKERNLSLKFEKEGYKPYTRKLKTTMNGWFLGNIITGGLLGSTTDGVSGAMIEFSPDEYFVTLSPNTPFGISTSKPRKIKELLVAFGNDIRVELSGGVGEKLDSILNILETKETEKNTTIKVLSRLAVENENNLDFANTIIRFYNVK